MNFSLQDKPCSNQMADSWFPTAMISHFYSAVYVREKSVGATAADLMRTDKWVYDWLKRFDAGGLGGLRDLPKSGRPASVPRTTMDRIIGKASQGRCTPKELPGARTHRGPTPDCTSRPSEGSCAGTA